MLVTFHIQYRCEYGQRVALLGAPEQLGAWDPTRCVKMSWSKGNIWAARVALDIP